MNDRELLELAAKAAAIELRWVNDFDDEGVPVSLDHKCWCFIPAAKPPHNRRASDDMQGGIWNPLTDDGDALRLAVKLNMDFTLSGKHAAVVQSGDILVQEYCNSDPCAATRRAIVRAAAEIGRVK